MPKITIVKCACGHRSCQDYWLNGIGKFVQGSGFTEDEAQRIADALNTPATPREAFDAGWGAAKAERIHTQEEEAQEYIASLQQGAPR